jgi:hypothetical protein
VLLLDEYEKPVSYLFANKYEEKYGEIIGFHDQLMTSTFKDTPINYSIMAGILKTGPSGKAIHLNNYLIYEFFYLQSSLRFNECDLLKNTEWVPFFGFSKEDVAEMANDVKEKCKIEIPEDVLALLWSWCNGN